MAGNERLSYEIAAIYSGSPEIKKAFDDFARLNAQGQRVVNQLERMGSQVKKTGEEIRNSRQGAAQLGMQFNQLGTQVVSGTSVFTAFAQQIGDVGYAMSFMGGTAGRIGTFLAGPWGAAIGIAAVALGPFINRLFETANAADVATEAMDRLIKKSKASVVDYEELAQAETKLADAVDRRGNVQRVVNNLEALGGRRNDRQERLLRARREELTNLNMEVLTYEDAINKQRKYLVNKEEEARVTDRAAASTKKLSTARAAMSRVDDGAAAARQIERETRDYNNLAEKLQSIVNIRTSETEEIGKAKNELAEFDKLVQEIAGATVGGESVGARLVGQMEPQILAVRKQLVEATLGMQEYMTAIPPMSAAAEEAFKRQKDAIDSVGMSVSNAFKGMLTAGASWKDGMKGIIQTVIDELWRLFVVQQIVGMVTNVIGGMFGGGGLSAKDPLAKAFDAALPGRAMGGSVSANTPYIVGEKGPELFVPGGNGTIIPNKNMGGGGGAPTINVTVDARGSADPAAVRAQVQQGILEAAPAIIAAAEQRTVSNMRRPRLGGAMQ